MAGERGLFITFDGQHGAGKTYNINNLNAVLIAASYPVVCLKEPSYSTIGNIARQSEETMVPEAVACLFAADRYQQCKEIENELALGKIVLCDRYFISALILQNIDGLEFDFIRQLNSKIIKPDLAIVVYAQKDIILERIKKKNITRFTKIEMQEPFDRYVKHRREIEVTIKNVKYFPNNYESDAKTIADYVLAFVSAKTGETK